MNVPFPTDRLFSAGGEVRSQYAKADIASSATDSSIVAATTGKKIRVIALACVTGSTPTTITFNSKGSGAGTAISCQFQNGANGGEVLNFNPAGWFETTASQALTATTGAGSTTGVIVTYILVS